MSWCAVGEGGRRKIERFVARIDVQAEVQGETMAAAVASFMDTE
jgi:hypothetical protein